MFLVNKLSKYNNKITRKWQWHDSLEFDFSNWADVTKKPCQALPYMIVTNILIDMLQLRCAHGLHLVNIILVPPLTGNGMIVRSLTGTYKKRPISQNAASQALPYMIVTNKLIKMLIRGRIALRKYNIGTTRNWQWHDSSESN